MYHAYQPTLPDDADEFQAFFRQRRPPQTAPAPPAPSVHSAQRIPFIPQPSGADEQGAMGFRANTSGGSTAHQLPPIQQEQLDLYQYIPPEYSAFSNPITPVPVMTGFQNIGNVPGGSTHALRPRAHEWAGEYDGPSQPYYGPQPIATPHAQLYEQIEMPRVQSDTNIGGIAPAPQTRPIAGRAHYAQRRTLQIGEDTPVQFARSPVSGTQSSDPYRRTETVQIPPHLGEIEGETAPGSRPIAGQGRYAKHIDAPRVSLPVQADGSTDLPQETEATSLETENGPSTEAGGKAKAKRQSRAADPADGTQEKSKKKNKGKQKAPAQDEAGDAAPQAQTRRPTNVVPLKPTALYMSYDAEREAQRVHDENYYPFAYVFPAAGPYGRDVVYRLTDETAAPVPEEEGCVYELVYIVSDVPWAYTQCATPDGPLVLRQTPTPESELPITMDAVYRKYTTRIAVIPLKTDSTQGTTRTRKLGDGDVECDECGRPHKDSVGAKNAHQKRWHV